MSNSNIPDASDLILYGATCCCFSALFTKMPDLVGCSAQEECLCIEYEACCRAGANKYGPGCETGNGYICKCQLICCQYALKVPKICCKGAGQCCCFVSKAAFPPDEDVPMMCAVCFIACCPTFGVCKKVSEVKK